MSHVNDPQEPRPRERTVPGDVGGVDGRRGEDVADAHGVEGSLGDAGRLYRRVGSVHLK